MDIEEDKVIALRNLIQAMPLEYREEFLKFIKDKATIEKNELALRTIKRYRAQETIASLTKDLL